MSNKISKLTDVWPGSFQELYMVFDGGKPSLLDGLSDYHNKDFIKKTLNDFGLETEVWVSSNNPADVSIAVGKNKDICLKVKEARENNDFYNLGILLGYPQCCVEHHLIGQEVMFLLREESTIYAEGDNKRLDYRINTLFSRQNIGSKQFEKMFGSRAIKYIENKYYYLSHIPCSVECRESFEIAEKTGNVMEKYLPEENKKIEKVLKRGFIIFGFFDYIIFDYTEDGEYLKISNVTKTPIADNDKFEKIRGAEWLKLDKNSVVTSNNERLKCHRTIIFY